MALVHHDPQDGILITRIGQAEITVRPEPPASASGAPVILLRVDAPMLDTLAAAYLDPDEARRLAQALVHAAEAVRPATPWRSPRPNTR
ncbi:conserved hypothetical protein [Frankia canadensis]|uniref:Uncharacterized protein n=1 Tax=Frankia canadensis TaxID=1836972 RepID=A0A2I2KIF4_9ACTN|nr:hypothetical protein [Frankia canadensis]SNQ45434.1 conserved hypothetical protein [Frankia canadensis]SOU52724.1 conserved hypothetical protein [Frankia canadensis]